MHFRCNITQLLVALSLAFLTLGTMTSGMTLATTAKPALNETTNGSSHQDNSSTLVEASSHKNATDVNIIVPTLKSSTSTGQGGDDKRTSRYYSPFSSGYEDQFNPFPNYYPAALGGSNGVGVHASSCAYAYPNRRYSCYGLGRR